MVISHESGPRVLVIRISHLDIVLELLDQPDVDISFQQGSADLCQHGSQHLDMDVKERCSYGGRLHLLINDGSFSQAVESTGYFPS